MVSGETCAASFQHTRDMLEELYSEFNRREYVSPDPLEFLYMYDSPADREVVGLIASSLAYGRVASILASVRRVLDVLGKNPADALAGSDFSSLFSRLSDFKHRFNGGEEMCRFLSGVGEALRRYGSLENVFRGIKPAGSARTRQGASSLHPLKFFYFHPAGENKKINKGARGLVPLRGPGQSPAGWGILEAMDNF
ncbi:MAG: DUF2400 family protein, partial [Synergistaceae bacterium]|nr:DUF2400 family protein [Synergistaceae bacterium]